MSIARYKRTFLAMAVTLVTISLTSIYCWNYAPTRTPVAIFRFTETIEVKNDGDDPAELGDIPLEMFLNLEWQEMRILRVDDTYDVDYDKNRNPTLVLKGPPKLDPKQTYNATVTFQIESHSRRIPSISIEKSDELSDIPESLADYTKETPPWQSPLDVRLDTAHWNGTEYWNMSLREVADHLRRGNENVLQIVLNDAEWIKTYIKYCSGDPTYPGETARNAKGDCDDQSNLLISLLRFQGIPSFLMMGQVYLMGSEFANISSSTMGGHFIYEVHHTLGHAWAMVYVPPWGWLPCDPVVSSPGSTMSSITQAYVLSPGTIVFKNLTGVNEVSDYIGDSRNETRMAEEKSLYFWLIQDMEQIAVPMQVVIQQSKIFVFYAEIVCFTALIGSALICDRRGIEWTRRFLSVYCSYCGAKNACDAVYCGQCGRRMKD